MGVDRRRFAMELLAIGAGATACSAGPRLLPPEGSDAATTGGTESDAATPPLCPTGTTGVLEGFVLPYETEITGRRGGTGDYGPISLCEYFDPDGSRSIDALLVIRSGVWCLPCKNLAKAMRPIVDGYLARRARIVEVLVNGSTADVPATQSSVDAWIKSYGCTYDVARAAAAALGTSETEGIPICYFVNPRTMLIEKRHIGSDIVASGKIPFLEAILATNGA